MSFIINPNSISPEVIKTDLENWLEARPDSARWKDFFASSVGQTIVDLISGLGAFLSYNSIAIKRESYLHHAKVRSSAIAASEYLGYSAYRGENTHLQLTIIPSYTGLIEKYSVVGSVKDQDLIALGEFPVNEGIETTINVAIGILKTQETTASSDSPSIFRFSLDGISEDIRIFINDVEVEHSSRLVDLIHDKFAIISNAIGSVDAFSLNSLTAPTRYSTGSTIKIEAIELKNVSYEESDINFDFGQLSNVQVASAFQNQEGIDDIKINAPLYHETQFVIRGRQDYSKSLKLLDTSIVDTNYRDISAAVVELVYVRNLLPVFTQQEKQELIDSLSSFRPMGLEPPTIVDPVRVPLTLNFYTKLLSNSGTLNSDIDSIMSSYEKKLGQAIDFDTIENEVEELDYIKISRVSIGGDSWESGKSYPCKIHVKPTVENGLVYKARVLRRSGLSEPDFTGLASEIGETVEDGRIIWKCISIPVGLTPDPWQPSFAYNKLDIVQPIVPNGKAYQVFNSKNYSYSTSEIQKIEFSSVPVSGKWRIEYDGETTIDLEYNATPLDIQTALETLSNVGAGNIEVSGDYTSGFTIEFINQLANMPIETMVFNNPGVSETQVISYKYVPTSGTWSLSFMGDPTSALAHNAPAATIKTALEALPSIGAGNVEVSGNYTSGFTVVFKGSLSNEDLEMLVVNSSTLTANNVSVLVSQQKTQEAAVVSPPQDEVQTLRFSRAPNSGHWALSFNGKVTSLLQYNSPAPAVQAALEALPDIGVGNVVVSGDYVNDLSVSFVGALQQQDVDLLGVYYNSLMFDDSLGQSVNAVPSVLVKGAPSAQNEKQRITFNLTPDNGTWKIRYEGETTVSLAHNAPMATIQSALQSLSSIGAGNASVAGSFATGINIEFLGSLSNQDLDLVEVVDSTLVLVSTPVSTSVSEITNGASAAANSVQKVSFNEVPTEGFWSIQLEDKVTTPLFHSATSSVVETALESLPNVGAGNVTVSGDFSVGFTIEFVGTLSNTYVNDIAITSNTLVYRIGVDQQVTIIVEQQQIGHSGTASANEIQTLTFTEVPTLGQWRIRYNEQQTALLPYNATLSQIEDAIADGISVIGRDGASQPNVSVAGNFGSGIDIEFVNDLAETDMAYSFEVIESTLTISPANATITIQEAVKGMFPANSLYDGVSNPVVITPSNIVDADYPEPDWGSISVGDTIDDHEITWLALNINGTPDYWEPEKVYNTGEYVVPTDPTVAQGMMFQCIGYLGVSGDVEPVWPLSVGGSVESNDVEWTAKNTEISPEQLAYNEYYVIDQVVTSS